MGMRALWEQDVFSVGDQVFQWRDVVLAAVRWGDWSGVVSRARTGEALLAAELDAEEATLSADEVEAACNEFRYDRDLTTADETEAWLERWGLDLETWSSWITVGLLRDRAEPGVAEGDGAQEPGEAAIQAEAVCSRALTRFAYRLASRAAIAARSDQESQPSGSGLEPDEVPPEVDVGGLSLGLSPDEVRERFRMLAGLEGAYHRFAEAAVTPETIEARIRTHQADWIRVRTRSVLLSSEDVAREALLSIREDGASLEELAEDAATEVEEGSYYLEELEPAVLERLMAAQKGELVGPVRQEDRFGIFLVLDKLPPSSSDPVIADRARESLLDSAVSREVDNRVTWLWQP